MSLFRVFDAVLERPGSGAQSQRADIDATVGEYLEHLLKCAAAPADEVGLRHEYVMELDARQIRRNPDFLVEPVRVTPCAFRSTRNMEIRLLRGSSGSETAVMRARSLM